MSGKVSAEADQLVVEDLEGLPGELVGAPPGEGRAAPEPSPKQEEPHTQKNDNEGNDPSEEKADAITVKKKSSKKEDSINAKKDAAKDGSLTGSTNSSIRKRLNSQLNEFAVEATSRSPGEVMLDEQHQCEIRSLCKNPKHVIRKRGWELEEENWPACLKILHAHDLRVGAANLRSIQVPSIGDCFLIAQKEVYTRMMN